MAIGNGFSQDITDQITSIGTNLISVSTDFDGSGGYPALSISDVEALSDPDNVPSVSEITAKIDGSRIVVFGGESMNTTVSGVMANYLAMNSLDEFQLGDGLTQNDIDTSARVAVLGAGIASDLFGSEFPIGEQVRINGVGYEVVGVLEESGGGLAGFTDDTVYIPLTTSQSRLYTDRTRTGEKIVTSITAQAASSEQVEDAINDVTRVLRNQHGINYGDDDDFQIFDQSSLLDTVNTVVGSLTAFLGAIAAISLLVGGIGIMNIMLVSVTERTREIGIRKAIGALRRDILMQFLLESMVLSLLGGVLGIALGWLISFAAGSLFDLTMAVDIGTILLSASFAAAVGLIFGIYPAWRASNLRPIEALRYE
jgi:putative ABC transport system permease protein